MEKEFMNLLFMVKTLVLALYGGMPLEERQAEEICKELDKIEDRMNELSGGKNVDASDSNCTIHGCARCSQPITDIKPEDVIFKIGDDVKKVTKFEYNPFHGGYDFEWE